MGMYRHHGDGISIAAYTGDRAVLLAFDLAADRADGLAALRSPGSHPPGTSFVGTTPFVRHDFESDRT